MRIEIKNIFQHKNVVPEILIIKPRDEDQYVLTERPKHFMRNEYPTQAQVLCCADEYLKSSIF
jgi:hypothetical protein